MNIAEQISSGVDRSVTSSPARGRFSDALNVATRTSVVGGRDDSAHAGTVTSSGIPNSIPCVRMNPSTGMRTDQA